MREVWGVFAGIVAGVVLLAWLLWPEPAAAPPDPGALERTVRTHTVVLAVAAVPVTVGLSVLLVMGSVRRPGRAELWLRLVHNLLVLSVAGVLLAGSALALIAGEAWFGPGSGSLLVAGGGVALAVLLLDRATVRHRTWLGLFFGNDFWQRLRSLAGETERLWGELVRGRKGQGGV